MTARSDRADIVTLTVPAPVAPLETFLRAAPPGMSVLWAPPGGWSFAAAGVARSVSLRGADRLRQLRAALALWQDVESHSEDPRAPRPRLFGGLAFAPHGNDRPPWDEFSDGFFALPRWTYALRGTDAFLTLAIDRSRAGSVDEVLCEHQRLAAALAAHGGSAAPLAAPSPVPAENVEQLDPVRWRERLELIASEIQRGCFAKVVAARACRVRLPDPVDSIEVVARLAERGVETPDTRFLFQRERAALVGASPEVLFEKAGRSMRTEALAGTVGSHRTGGAQQLLESQKDQREHQFVVRHIVDELGGLVDHIAVGDPPTVRKARDVIHLFTSISAQLRPGVDACDLLEVLHPTPAVGGWPRSAAVDFITAHERRGWYTGAVGWLDLDGDATFNVVIRAGLLEENRVAHVFAGAGIIAGSDPETEYDETALKQRPMLRALGVLR